MYIKWFCIETSDLQKKLLNLKIDNICYGYYYAEEVANNIPNTTYLEIHIRRR